MTTSISQSLPVQEVKVQRKSGDVKKGDEFQEVLKKTLKTKEEEPREEDEKKESLPADPLRQELMPQTMRSPEELKASTLALSGKTGTEGILEEMTGPPVDGSVDGSEIPVEEKPEGNPVPFKLQDEQSVELQGRNPMVQEDGDDRIIRVPRNEGNLPKEELQSNEGMKRQEVLSPKEMPLPPAAEAAKEAQGVLADKTVQEPSNPKKDGAISKKENLSESMEESQAVSGKKSEVPLPVHPEVFQKLSVKEDEGSEPVKPGTDMNLSEKITEAATETRSQETIKAAGHTEAPGRIPFEENLELATTKILERMETISEGNRTTMKVKLHPEEMGEMEITLTLEEGKLSGKILLENHEMRQLFARRIDELSENLKASSVNVLKFEVGVGDKEAGNQARQQGNPFRPSMNPFSGFKGYMKEEHETSSPGNKSLSGLEGVNLLA